MVDIKKNGGISRNELETNSKFKKLVSHIKITLKMGNHYKYP